MTARRFSSIRSRVTLLVLVPLLALAALWAFLTSVTYGDANQLLKGREFQRKSLQPTQRLIDALQKERRLSMAELGGPRPIDRGVLLTQRQTTDDAQAAVRRGGRDAALRGAVRPEVRHRIDALLARLDTLGAARRSVDDHVADRGRVLAEYSALIDAGFAVYSAIAPGNGTITGDARTLTAFGRAREFLTREDALLTGAIVARRLTAAERGEFAQLVGAHRLLEGDAAPNLPAADRAAYEALAAGPEYRRLRTLEDQILRAEQPEVPAAKTRASGPGVSASPGTGTGTGTGTSGTGASGSGPGTSGASGGGRAASSPRTPPVDAAQWRSTADSVNSRLFDLENRAQDDITARGRRIADGVFLRLLAAGGLGLAAIVLSTYIAMRVSRRLVRECRTLAAGVVDFTQQRLPRLAAQVRAGEPAEAEPPPDFDYRIREVRQIADSFDRAREAVLLAAAGEVAARRGISEVFVNLARRNQALLHRQLSLLDTMERRTEDPAELSDLFRLDHLATRMRRHAEGLVILAGKSAGRGWRRPVPLVDVVRGAVAEVEDYPRVRVQPLPRIALLGTAVADIIHLLAELVENATTFSPPQSPVRVSGHPVASGFALEIEDRGLGMTEEALRAANARLAEPPEFDPADSAQLGLIVVGRLAARHDIKVTLRPSPYGGTTAIALVPGVLIVDGSEPDPVTRRPTGPLEALPQQPAAVLAAAGRAGGEPGVMRLVAEAGPSRRVPSALPAAAPPVPAPMSAPAEAVPAQAVPAENAPSEAPPPDATPEPARAPDPEPAQADAPATAGGLPKRRRQTHLAPQLKERVDARLAARGQRPPEPAGAAPLAAPVPMETTGPPPADAAAPAAAPGGAAPVRETAPAAGTPPAGGPEANDARSPEELRTMLSAMQRGWQRGRHDAAEAEAGQNRGDQEDDTP